MSHVAERQSGPIMDLECENATVHWTTGTAEIAYTDGSTETIVDGDERMRSLPWKNMVNAIRQEEPIVSTLEVGRVQTLCINGAHESCPDVTSIPQSEIREVTRDDSRFIVVDGLDQLLVKSADEGRLFSELGVSWATARDAFDMTGYGRFPSKDNRR